LRLGVAETWFVVSSTGNYLKGLIAGRESADQLSGPIRIAQVSGEVAKMGIAPLINLAAILSISIGLLNLLPIPLLDGGFLLFFAYEAIRGKALGDRTQQVGFRIGLSFVAALTIFAAYNDLSRLFMPKSVSTSVATTPGVSK
jgi:regulator of sigma E protease